MDFSQPAAQLLLDGDDRGGGVLPRRADALQQLQASLRRRAQSRDVVCVKNQQSLFRRFAASDTRVRAARLPASIGSRSEEHTSELQSLAYHVCRLLLEKKKKIVTEPRQ